MLRWLTLVALLCICCSADNSNEKCIEECKLDEDHTFSEHEQDVCKTSEFHNKFLESSNAKCGQPIETVVRLKAKPGITYTPHSVKVKRCRGPCKKSELTCKPTKTSKVTFHIRTEHENGKGCGTIEVDEHEACECDCSISSDQCKENQEYDNDACQCKCKNEDEMSECEMEVTKEWQHDSCSCKCRSKEECDAMHEWSDKDCKCVGNEVKRSADTAYHHYHR
ncbi:hypothetical protein C0J52_09076 [Blattella germanica]|nr:hypothetical protein C0J52_09076 [Blattella germanica]